MNQTARAFDTLPLCPQRHSVKLLVAVGVDGNAVVVSVLEGNQDLLQDVTTLETAMALWPSPIPTLPGLYLFSGHTQEESLDEGDETTLREVFHRCTYRPISSAELIQLKPAI